MTWGQGRYVSPKVKATVRRRDKTCRLAFPGCTVTIQEFHHPDGLADQGKQRTSVLNPREVIGVCSWCHAIDTRQRQAAGRARAALRGTVSRRNRDQEQHPCSLPGVGTG